MSRREFVKTAAATVALASFAGAEGEKPVRIGVVGCGGRGTGAAKNCLDAAPNVQLVAMGDLFEERLKSSRGWLAKKGHTVDDKRCYVGFDAYKQVLDCNDIDLVLFATPPGFRPLHVEAAVNAGKHVFMEKPIAVDPVGVRRIRAAGKKAREKGLAVVAGTQYRHHAPFTQTIEQVHNGRIGKIVAGRAYYNSGGVWFRARKQGMDDMAYQCHNWYYFNWLSGDHIVEQHVHTIDVTNWVMNAPPVRAVAVGGRSQRTDKKYGNIFDHFAVDYEYPGGVHVVSMCRHWKGCATHVGAYFEGTKGVAKPYQGRIEGEQPFAYDESKKTNPYVAEHTNLIASIRANKPLNEAEQIADSTLTAIMGREAAYSGRAVTWEDMTTSDMDLAPKKYEFGPLAMRSIPVPGRKA